MLPLPRHQVHAQLPRLLTAAALLALAACTGAAPAALPPAPPAQPVDAALQRPRVPPLQPWPQDGEFGPEVLLPPKDAADDEVARVGELVLRKSDAFTRLLAADPKVALSTVDLLVFDVLVANHARQYGIRVDKQRVRELAQRDEQQLAQQVQQELGGSLSLADYVWRIFGMRLPDWRSNNELRTAQRLYQGYVIRYLALRSDRTQVRYIVHRDRQLLQELAQKVREGADFATLALRHSEDALRRDGGLLPPFGDGFPHPVAKVALQLHKGELSEVFAAAGGDEPRYYLVYCIDRLQGRDVAFAAVREEIDQDLQRRPITPIETNAYTLRWRSALEAAPKTDDKPAERR